jgi:hypothetical protein
MTVADSTGGFKDGEEFFARIHVVFAPHELTVSGA